MLRRLWLAGVEEVLREQTYQATKLLLSFLREFRSQKPIFFLWYLCFGVANIFASSQSSDAV